MSHKRYFYILLIGCMATLFACQPQISDDPTARLSFSADTVRFDTVFTSLGSATTKLMVYNKEKKAIHINNISLENGAQSVFKLNIDGLTNNESSSSDITLEAGDSLFIFIRLYIDPTDSLNPVFISDRIVFHFNQTLQAVELEAYGQDVEIIRSTIFKSDTTLLGKKPYLIYDYVAIDTARSLTIAAGSTFFFHDEAQMVIFGSLKVEGTLEQPVRMLSDRLDNLFTDVPYRMVAGRWDGLNLVQIADRPDAVYDINYLEVTSGTTGLFCTNNDPAARHPQLTLTNSKIHNMSRYGVVLQNTNATVANCQISNCAQYCLYLSGGTHTIIHSTIASYFNNTDVRIQSVPREDMAAVYVNDLNKGAQQMDILFCNSIVTGIRKNNFVLATPFEQQFNGTFANCYLRNDSINLPQFQSITYAQEQDTVFENIFYKYKEYVDYSFMLDSVSPCRDIADTTIARQYPLDRLGRNRFADQKPDLGCYEWQ